MFNGERTIYREIWPLERRYHTHLFSPEQAPPLEAGACILAFIGGGGVMAVSLRIRVNAIYALPFYVLELAF